MKKYFFALFLFIIALIFIDNAYAASSNGWGFDAKRSTQAHIYDCNSSHCDQSLNAKSENIDDSTFYFWSYDQTNMSANGPGNMWVYLLESPLSNNYLYSVTSYVCSLNYSANLVFKGYYSSSTLSNVYNRVDSGTTYFSQTLNNLGSYPYTTSDGAMGSCSYFTSIYKPNVNSKFVGINFSTDLQRNNFASSFIGYKVESLGLANNLSSSDIQNIIASSGLATASDISSLNSSISSIQNQLSNNISQAETSINNNIDSAESNINDNTNRGINSVNDNLRAESENIQNGIKDGFEQCRDSVNLYPYEKVSFVSVNTDWVDVGGLTGMYQVSNFNASNYKVTLPAGTYTLSYYDSVNVNLTTVYLITVRNNAISILGSASSGTTFTLSEETVFLIRFKPSSVGVTTSLGDIQIQKGSSVTEYEKYGEQICKNRIDSTNEKLDDLNNTMNNDDVSGANSDASSFFSGFNSNSFGLSSIITMPLEFISHLTDNNTCNSLVLPLPFVNQNVTLPCMTSIYNTYFHDFLVLYQTITTGFISYWVCVNIFRLVRVFKSPENDQVEVMEL